MAAATVVTGVFAELEEVLDIVMPCLKVSTARAFAFATLVHCQQLVIVKFEERDDALGFTIGALDVTTCAADSGP